MTAEKIKNRINEMCTIFEFEYNGVDGNIDPYYIPKTNDCQFLLFFDGKEQIVHSIDEVMSTPFINGKSLSELYDKIKVTGF